MHALHANAWLWTRATACGAVLFFALAVPCARAQEPGIGLVPLNPADPDPAISVCNRSALAADGLVFRLHGEAPPLALAETRLTDAVGDDVGWTRSEPPDARGCHALHAPPGAPDIAPSGGGVVEVQSSGASGWEAFSYTLLRHGRTLYPAVSLRTAWERERRDGTAADAAPARGELTISDHAPAAANGHTEIVNEGPLALTDVTLRLGGGRRFRDVHGSARGSVAFDDDGRAAVYVFEAPLPPGGRAELWWDHARGGGQPGGTTITMTGGTTGLVPVGWRGMRTMRPGAAVFAPGTLRLAEVAAGTAGGAGGTIRLTSDGTWTFAPARALEAHVVEGELKLGEPVAAGDRCLEIPVLAAPESEKAAPSVIEIRGLLLDTGLAAAARRGPMWLFVQSTGSGVLGLPLAYWR